MGAGHVERPSPEGVDVFNPYDGYALMAQFLLEAFQWHGVKSQRCLCVLRGRYQGRETVPFLFERWQFWERAHPYGMDADRIEQLRGTAGPRQVRVRAETALAAFTTPSSGGWIMFGKSPS